MVLSILFVKEPIDGSDCNQFCEKLSHIDTSHDLDLYHRRQFCGHMRLHPLCYRHMEAPQGNLSSRHQHDGEALIDYPALRFIKTG